MDTTAETVFWANGVKRDFAPVETHGDTKIQHLAAANSKVVMYMQEVGLDVWHEYLKPAGARKK